MCITYSKRNDIDVSLILTVVKTPTIRKESHYESSGGFFFGLYKSSAPKRHDDRYSSSSSSAAAVGAASTSPLYIPPSGDFVTTTTRAPSLAAASTTTSTSFSTTAAPSTLPGEAPYLAGAYLTLKTDESRDRWLRYYFVLRDRTMVYYKDKRTFDESPASAINQRPVDLEGYRLLAGSDTSHFLITLLPTQEFVLPIFSFQYK